MYGTRKCYMLISSMAIRTLTRLFFRVQVAPQFTYSATELSEASNSFLVTAKKANNKNGLQNGKRIRSKIQIFY